MSGREPVAAFFPSIDRNLIAELDRHLRAPSPAPQAERPKAPEPRPVAQPTGRPDIDGIVEAVEYAATSLSAMTERISELETQIATLDATNRTLTQQLGQTTQRYEVAESKGRAEGERAEQSERIAAHHLARADVLERDLASALGDLNRVTDAIANALGVPDAG